VLLPQAATRCGTGAAPLIWIVAGLPEPPDALAAALACIIALLAERRLFLSKRGLRSGLFQGHRRNRDEPETIEPESSLSRN